MAGKSTITAPPPAPQTTDNQQLTASNSKASQPPVQAVDDDGWVVQSASVGAMAATPEELKARAESVKVGEEKPGRRDVRPGSKDSLNPDAAADPTQKQTTLTTGEEKVDERPAGEQPRDDKGKFAKKDEPPAAAAGEAEAPPAGDEAAEAAAAAAKPEVKRLPGETRSQFRKRLRHAQVQGQIDDQVAERERLRLENEKLRLENEKLREVPPKKDEEAPPADELPTREADPKPTWKAFQAEGKSWDEYTDAKDSWNDRELERTKRELTDSVRRDTSRDTVVQQRAAAFSDRVAQVRQAHPDFDETVGQLTMENTPFVARLLANHPRGPELMYYLGQHLDQAYDLAELTSQTADLGGGRVAMHPSHAPIFDALMTSPEPAKLLSALLDPEAGHFERIAQLSGASALRELVKLEGSSAAPVTAGNGDGRPQGGARKPAAPPLRPPGGAAAAGAQSRAGQTADDLEFGPEFVRNSNEADRRRGRRW